MEFRKQPRGTSSVVAAPYSPFFSNYILWEGISWTHQQTVAIVAKAVAAFSEIMNTLFLDLCYVIVFHSLYFSG